MMITKEMVSFVPSTHFRPCIPAHCIREFRNATDQQCLWDRCSRSVGLVSVDMEACLLCCTRFCKGTDVNKVLSRVGRRE